jgi:hypothetical protein
MVWVIMNIIIWKIRFKLQSNKEMNICVLHYEGCKERIVLKVIVVVLKINIKLFELTHSIS